MDKKEIENMSTGTIILKIIYGIAGTFFLFAGLYQLAVKGDVSYAALYTSISALNFIFFYH